MSANYLWMALTYIDCNDFEKNLEGFYVNGCLCSNLTGIEAKFNGNLFIRINFGHW